MIAYENNDWCSFGWGTLDRESKINEELPSPEVGVDGQLDEEPRTISQLCLEAAELGIT